MTWFSEDSNEAQAYNQVGCPHLGLPSHLDLTIHRRPFFLGCKRRA